MLRLKPKIFLKRHIKLVLFVALFCVIGVATILRNFAASPPLHALGALPPPAGVRSSHALPSAQTIQSFPASVNLAQWAAPVGDQGQVDSCVAWAVDHSLFGWYANRFGYGGSGQHAPMYTYAQIVKGQNVGTTPAENFAVAETQGIAAESAYYQGDYDYTSQPTAAEHANAASSRVVSHTNLFTGVQPGSVAQILLEQQLATGYPAIIEIPVYPQFDNANSTNSLVGMPVAGQALRGFHEVTALGYTSQGLLIENQWGTGWGNKGYATLSWSFVNTYTNEADAISGVNIGLDHLIWTNSSAHTDTGLGVAAGTSPSITALGDGGYEVAFRAANGHLWTAGEGGSKDWGLGVAPGTSPSIHALYPSGYGIAFNAAGTDHLWVANSSGAAYDTGWGMAAGTSPSYTAIGTSFEIAFQAYNQHLWTYGYDGVHDSGLGVAPGTSPAITGLWSGGYQIAFNAFGSGHLWVTGSAGVADTGLGVASGTSPAISPIYGSYEVAFQAGGGHLWTAGWGGGKDSGLGMASGTSPSMSPVGGSSYEIAFQAGGGHLWTAGWGGGKDRGVMVSPGTGPGITILTSGDAQIAFRG
jgi:hypothetical protein